MSEPVHQTRTGGRHSNQDRLGFACTDESMLLVVCDGMGGHANGEVAAQYVVDCFDKSFHRHAAPSLDSPARFLAATVRAAADGLHRLAAERRYPETPSTTCVAAVIQNGAAWWINVGDSRLYLVRNGAVAARTRDHSYVQILIEEGLITEQEAAWHPERNKIYNCIGQRAPVQIDLTESVPLSSGDVLLLCSDGLWGNVPERALTQAITRYGLAAALPMLMDMAQGFGGEHCDNLSALGYTHWAPNPPHGARTPGDKPVTDRDIADAVEAIRRSRATETGT